MKKFPPVLALLFSFLVDSASAYNAVLVADIDSGRIIYAENADDLNYPASLTKIMTLYLTFNALEQGRLRLDQNLIVSRTAANAKPVKIGIPAGSKITVENAVKAVAVYSANDMAVVLSENLVGDEGDFAAMMTKVATEIGLKNTNFSNASGLSDDGHISTAKDMALLAIAVKKHYPEYWHYFSIPYFSYEGKSFKNGNGLLGVYEGCDGMKTGFTNRSKYSLVSTARQNGRHLVAVVLGADDKDDRVAISRALLDLGFGKTKKFNPAASARSAFDAPPAFGTSEAAHARPAPSASTYSSSSAGSGGVQFGAFGSEKSAKLQQEKVYALFGLDTYLERFNNLFRVRARLSNADAQKVKGQCASRGVDCFIFK
ncbi:MAG: D-alanyl-D-alanine carboxypeptidase [Rickettsiales bacterium]|nr:D-alanyl-D-alanine carboxypeptidase [Rickettsiales bacterium]